MKQSIFTAVLLFFATLISAQKAEFKIKYSEQLAVFVFVQNLSENYPDNVFKTQFTQSKYNTKKYQDLITQAGQLEIDYSYEFTGFPYGSKIPMQTKDILKKNLIETENLQDFKLRSIGILPIYTLNKFVEIITAFTPVYNELIYNPNKEKFEKQVSDLKKYAQEKNIETYFETGLIFYHSSWDPSIPFEIAFYPLPDSDSFTAQAFYNNFVSAVQVNLKDYKGLFSVMMHEIFHIIYDEQSLEVKTEIDKNFKENKSKVSNYAFQLLNEALATATGNGYVYEQLDGKPDPDDWYYRKYINLMAKKIYPLVKQYIAEKKPIDKNFIDSYITLYEKNFPDWINELDHIMSYRYVISENDKDFAVFNRMFRYRSSSEYETLITGNSLEKMQKSPLTKVIIISNSADKLKLVKNQFKELKNWKFNADKEFVHQIFLNDKSQLFIINQKKSSLESLLNSTQKK